MNYFNLDNNLDFMLNQFGKNITINGITATALISQENTKYDNIKIITKSPLKRGDLIIYNGNSYLMNNEIDNKKYELYYKGKARHCNYKVKFVIGGLYLKEISSLIDSKIFSISTDKYFNLSNDTILVILQDNVDTNSIKVSDRFIKMGRPWKVIAIDKTETGLIVLTCTLELIQEGDDLVNEVPSGYIKPVISITNANPSVVTLGTHMQITVSVIQNGTALTDIPISYISSNTSVATINETGLITPLTEGSTDITVCLTEETDINTTLTVNVTQEITHNYNISLTGGTSVLTLKVNTSGNIVATVTDNGLTITDKVVKWSLSDNINGTGIATYATITGISADTFTTTVLAGSTGGKYATLYCSLIDDSTISTHKYICTNTSF